MANENLPNGTPRHLGSSLDPFSSGYNGGPWYGPDRLLSDSAVAALIIYHDLLTFAYRKPTFVTPLLAKSNLYADWAVTEWQQQEVVSFPWPIPPAVTFFELDRFKRAWNDAIKSKYMTSETAPERRAERLLFAWLATGTTIVMHQSSVRLPEPSLEVPWRHLVDQLDQAADEITNRRKGPYREWLLSVLELLMPEMGLPQGVTAHFKESATLRFWQEECRLVIQQRRAERLAALSDVDNRLAESLRASREGFAGDFAPDEERVRSLSRQGQRQSWDKDGYTSL